MLVTVFDVILDGQEKFFHFGSGRRDLKLQNIRSVEVSGNRILMFRQAWRAKLVGYCQITLIEPSLDDLPENL